MNPETKISGDFKVKDWIRDSAALTLAASNALWDDGFENYFRLRLKTRYFDPVANLAEDSNNEGKGFSIVAIQCSLIEFLESTYKGQSFRYHRRGDPPLDINTEYGSSSSVFTAFLDRVSIPAKLAPFSDETGLPAKGND